MGHRSIARHGAIKGNLKSTIHQPWEVRGIQSVNPQTDSNLISRSNRDSGLEETVLPTEPPRKKLPTPWMQNPQLREK